MTKMKIYIDFEAISSPFSNDAKLITNFPYAYTLGIYVGKKFKTKTFVFNFHNDNTDDIYEVLRINIIKHIQQILAKKTFKVNQNSIKFIGWDPLLEKKILKHVFPGIDVDDLNKGRDISLSRITPEIKSGYFEYVRKVIATSLSKKFIAKRVMESDGAIAAYVGYLLHAQIHNKKGKFVANIDLKTVLKELKRYSKDDVLRMEFLQSNMALFEKRKAKAEKLINDKVSVGRKITKTNNLIKKLESFDTKQSVSSLISSLEKEIKELEEEKTKIEDNFDNF